ncbi:MAG: methyltransferase domain-containing protein, partial [Akkermansiaceae bacterium]|nr:methyltransferase domain-containing protein [Akkermansiaceae bacterium]
GGPGPARCLQTTSRYGGDLLVPRSQATPSDVARHYDRLGTFYRKLWGEHLHHGVWNDPSDRSSVGMATRRLLELTVAPLGIQPGTRLIDIGCGYGADAHWIAERLGAEVTGLTLSPHQVEVASHRRSSAKDRVRICLGDWLDNNQPAHSFHAAIAIESLSHMQDKPAFFRQLARV